MPIRLSFAAFSAMAGLGQLQPGRLGADDHSTTGILRERTGGPSSPVPPLCARSGIALSFLFRQRLCDFAGSVDDQLCSRAERAVLQGDDSVWHTDHWQFNGQDLDV
jgi:hypothetical protein